MQPGPLAVASQGEFSMLALYVMRHAKSDWTVSDASDFERPLNKRGMKDVPRVGRALQGTGLLPQRVITSPAARALATAEGIASGLTPVPELVPRRAYLSRRSTRPEHRGCRTRARRRLRHGGRPQPRPGGVDRNACVEPRCGCRPPGLARIELEIGDWSELKGARGELQWLVTPRLLKGMGVR